MNEALWHRIIGIVDITSIAESPNISNPNWVFHKNLDKGEEFTVTIVFKNDLDVSKTYEISLDNDNDENETNETNNVEIVKFGTKN